MTAPREEGVEGKGQGQLFFIAKLVKQFDCAYE